jgi:hypothetical protein
MRHLKKIFAFLLTALLVLGAQPATADTVQSTFGLTYKSGINAGRSLGSLILSHPSFVFCTGTPGTSTACSYTVTAQVDNVAVLPLSIDVVDGSGQMAGSFTINSQSTTQVYLNASVNRQVYYIVSANNASVTGARVAIQATTLQVNGTPLAFQLEGSYGGATDQTNTRTFTVNSKLLFVQAGFPVAMHSSSECINVPIHAGPVDVTSGQPASALQRKDIDLEVYLVSPWGASTQVKYLSEARGTWNTSSSTTAFEIEICDIDPTSGTTNDVEVHIKATYRLQGTTYTGNSMDYLTITGDAQLKQIACVKGTKAMIVSSTNPRCPSGYSKSNIPIINGKLKTTTISCVKGLSVRRVTAVIPVCPSGFKRR